MITVENFRQINDSYFQVTAKFSEMDTATALKTHTMATLIMGITGLITIRLWHGFYYNKGYISVLMNSFFKLK